MTTVRFQLTSALPATQAFAVLTDFSATRADIWPSIDLDHLQVHDRGENWAEVTEGTDAAWERSRYEWDTTGTRVDVTTHDSKLFGAGGGWTFRLTPVADGTLVDVELVREPRSVKGRMLAALLPLVGPTSLKKSFATALQAR
ncbi:hypothetical protein LXM50_14505 [Microbacterium sp. Au-Mic1]|uniref:hypothetical protein n=1 Tax=Microbacterium sp. Au-Mic1 TaxID=2906457 RepID=UPI001E46DB18|nr:hypothetical protein [Microbacterium sp. Au-Mic1]MCE4027188.1 hypothetical protein [Microbacterium sp. Au-Mic1]